MCALKHSLVLEKMNCLCTLIKLEATHIYTYLGKKIDITPTQKDGPEKKITRLAIGVEGGFEPDDGKKYEFKESYSIVLMPTLATYSLDDPEVADKLSAVKAILEADCSTKLAELEALAGTWDGEKRIVTKHADNLKQLNNGVKIPSSGWQCSMCDLTSNLWLNLTDGAVLCGRKFFDGTGGNDHAVQHFSRTGYPLAVKLGTITQEGKADVFSYDEDDMVEDPNLVQHLAHFGINISAMRKTDKSMIELELEGNQKLGEWATMQEATGPIFGPGYTGMRNLGNSCYMNSVMQVIFSIEDFEKKYFENFTETFLRNTSTNPVQDFEIQMTKLGTGLLSGKYSKPLPEGSKEPRGISPNMFKNMISKGHPEFSTKHQQDAQEFFLHFLTTLQRNCRNSTDPSECFKFKVEDRFECGASHKVNYTYRTEYCLPLPIPLDSAINKDEVQAYKNHVKELESSGLKPDPNIIVRPIIKLQSCLEAFAKEDIIEQFFSSAINAKTTAKKTTLLSTFPDYLMLHLKKFMLKEDWTPMKLDVAVDMPDILDIRHLKGHGLQDWETPLPELEGKPDFYLDDAIIQPLVDMGFPLEAAKKAAFFTSNEGLDKATEWVMQHVGDSDFADTFVVPGTNSDKNFVPNEESLSMIMGMGFTKTQATKALKETNNEVDRAVDWIFSHPEASSSTEEESQPEFRDGSGGIP
uniref:Ubiquitin carboxyl-terminal hydrolase 14 n=1 Tax=Clastoptera arizonana TaxID=38151 RepID=A0A1B6CS55_9HEMI